MASKLTYALGKQKFCKTVSSLFEKLVIKEPAKTLKHRAELFNSIRSKTEEVIETGN